jgi:hypothetical protein
MTAKVLCLTPLSLSPPPTNHDHFLSRPQDNTKNKESKKPLGPTNPSPKSNHAPLPPFHTTLRKIFICKQVKTCYKTHPPSKCPPDAPINLPLTTYSGFPPPDTGPPFAKESDTRDRCCLKEFRHHICVHDIPYFRATHKVFILGPHSRQYFRISLCLLLTLNYVLRKVKISTPAIPHNCQLRPDITESIFHQCLPFKYIIANPQSRGRPRQDTIPPVSSTKELEIGNQTTPSTPRNQLTPTTLWIPELQNMTAPPSPPTLATHYHRQSLPPSQHHAPPTRCDVSGFSQNNQLYSQQWQQLAQILHQHDPQHTETCNPHPPSQTTIDTQVHQKRRALYSQTASPSKPPSFCPLSHPTKQHLEDVQKGKGFFLDC